MKIYTNNMPYKRSYRRRHYSARSRSRAMTRFKPRKPTRYKVADMAYKGFKLASQIASVINTEYKSLDVLYTGTPNAGGDVTLLNDIDAGDTISTRDGVQARMKSLECKWIADRNGSSTQAATRVRIVFFIWKDPKTVGLVPALTEILDTTAPGILALRNLDNRHDFVILKDYFLNLQGTNTSLHGEWYKELDMKTLWKSTDGTSVEQGALYVAAYSNEATNTPSVSVNARVRFIDN